MSFDHLEPLTDAEKILIIRKRLNMSQFQFAKELNISPSYISQVERGKLYPSNKVIEIIKEYLRKEKSNI